MSNASILNDVRTPYKHGKLVLEPSYKKSEFDSHAVDCPFMFYYNDKYYMTYVGWDSIGYRTGLAVSTDLEVWEKVGMIIDRGPRGSHTEFNIALTSILRDNRLFSRGELIKIDGKYIGTYHAYPNAGYESGAGVVGLCYSDDLSKWQVDSPVLFPEDGGAWESGGLYKSWILLHKKVFYLFYNAKNKTHGAWIEQTGFAVSDDLQRWRRYSENPVLRTGKPGSFDERFASDPCVLWHDGYWLMFYFGLSSDRYARDGLAVSRNLKEWEKIDGILVDVGPDGSIDSKYAHKPSLIAKGKTLYHFYCAVSPAAETMTGEVQTDERRGISFARSVDTQ
jgi:predicted GH43/DUF377 family glycosyl hydrolase